MKCLSFTLKEEIHKLIELDLFQTIPLHLLFSLHKATIELEPLKPFLFILSHLKIAILCHTFISYSVILIIILVEFA